MKSFICPGRPLDGLTVMSFLNGLVFFGPVSLLVRTTAGVSVSQFFLLNIHLHQFAAQFSKCSCHRFSSF